MKLQVFKVDVIFELVITAESDRRFAGIKNTFTKTHFCVTDVFRYEWQQYALFLSVPICTGEHIEQYKE